MADHTLDRQVGIDRISDDLKNVKNQISELRTLQKQGTDAVNIAVTGSYSSISLPVTTGNAAIFFFTLTPATVVPMFSTFHYTLYEGSVGAGNEINGQTLRSYNYDWRWWRDWANTDNANVKDYVWV